MAHGRMPVVTTTFVLSVKAQSKSGQTRVERGSGKQGVLGSVAQKCKDAFRYGRNDDVNDRSSVQVNILS